MTREHAKALLPFITAYAEGKTIQFLARNKGWVDLAIEPVTPCFNRPPESYRIKPEPVYDQCACMAQGIDCERCNPRGYDKPEPNLVPMTSDDFPPVFWLRRKSSQAITYLVQSIDTSDGEMWIEDGESVQPCDYPDWEYSADRKTWHSLMKEVTE